MGRSLSYGVNGLEQAQENQDLGVGL